MWSRNQHHPDLNYYSCSFTRFIRHPWERVRCRWCQQETEEHQQKGRLSDSLILTVEYQVLNANPLPFWGVVVLLATIRGQLGLLNYLSYTWQHNMHFSHSPVYSHTCSKYLPHFPSCTFDILLNLFMALAFESVCLLAHIHLFLSVKAIISEVRELCCGISVKTAHQMKAGLIYCLSSQRYHLYAFVFIVLSSIGRSWV